MFGNNEFKGILIFSCIFFVLGIFFTKSCLNKTEKSIVLTDTIVKNDTVFVYQEPIVIKDKIASIKYVRDTFIITKPFEARIDTIIKFDTVFAMYRYPENMFDLVIRTKPDTTLKEKVIITNTIVKERPLWIDILSHTGAVLGGFYIGKSLK